MKSKLLNLLNNRQFFSHHQFGYIAGKSTEEAISFFVGKVYNSFNVNSKTTAQVS